MLSSDLSGKRDCDLRDVYLSAEVFVGKLRRAGERTEDSCGNFIQRTIRAQLGQARKQNGLSGREFRQFALGVTNGFFRGSKVTVALYPIGYRPRRTLQRQLATSRLVTD